MTKLQIQNREEHATWETTTQQAENVNTDTISKDEWVGLKNGGKENPRVDSASPLRSEHGPNEP